MKCSTKKFIKSIGNSIPLIAFLKMSGMTDEAVFFTDITNRMRLLYVISITCEYVFGCNSLNIAICVG